MIEAIRRLSRNISFDEQPCTEINSEDIDFRAASEFFVSVSRKLTPAIRKTFVLIISQGVNGSLLDIFLAAGDCILSFSSGN